MENEQKPLYVIEVVKANITDAEFTRQINCGYQSAQEKVHEMSTYFPPGMNYYVSHESDESTLKFYLNFKLEF